MFSSLILLFFVLIQNCPTKIAPIFFVICWCDEVLLDLIRGFRVLQVDLAFPHLFPKFHPQNLPNFATDLTSPRGVLRIPSPDIRPDNPNIRPGPDIRPLTASLPSSTPFPAYLSPNFVPVPTYTSAYHHHFRIAPP